MIDNKMNISAKVLCEAIPYIDLYKDECFVISINDKIINDERLLNIFASDVVMLKQLGVRPIILHGNNEAISSMLDKFCIEPSYHDDMRVTDRNVIEITEMVLSGLVNKKIVAAINKAEGKGVGISGKDGNLFEANKMRFTKSDTDSNIEELFDLGFIGEINMVNPELINLFDENDFIPVISPIAVGENGETLHIHTDHAAASLAITLRAANMILYSNENITNNSGKIIHEMSTIYARKILENEVIKPEVAVKIENAIIAVESGVEAVHVINSDIEHGILVEIFTEEKIGTTVALLGDL